jgi:hypothetical protein
VGGARSSYAITYLRARHYIAPEHEKVVATMGRHHKSWRHMGNHICMSIRFTDIIMITSVSVHHIHEFFTLWMLLHDFHLVSKHMASDHYSVASAYKAPFLGTVLSRWSTQCGKFGQHQHLSSLLVGHPRWNLECR